MLSMNSIEMLITPICIVYAYYGVMKDRYKAVY